MAQLPQIWYVGIIAIIIWISYAAIQNDYKLKSKEYLTKIGRSDLIVNQGALTDQQKVVKLEKQIEYIRTDVDTILKKMNMHSVAPAASLN
jgi:hypothetical protein